MADVKVDLKQVENLGKEIRAGMIVSLGRLGERGYQLLRREIKDSAYVTGNLWQGVAPPDVDESDLSVTLTVSARSARTGGGTATVHYKSGKTKQISLRPQIAFNYAEVVARGRPAIRPKTGKALLIEVQGAPGGGTYITAGDKTFVVRRSAKATEPNPFDDRAGDQLEKEAPAIVGAVFGELFN